MYPTPKQLLDDVVISLIKQSLLATTLNNQQIADKFGFSDQSAFGQYFKRCTKLSPSEFRKRLNSSE
ncbi:MAG: AraC family transcriptional regulator [Sphingobacteriia bacterium]|jgi:AraC family transcriptional regulator, transcriptional activator of pobA|nr:AraC family transcriptional regulator [Sphingobacteriia bacterium]